MITIHTTCDDAQYSHIKAENARNLIDAKSDLYRRIFLKEQAVIEWFSVSTRHRSPKTAVSRIVKIRKMANCLTRTFGCWYIYINDIAVDDNTRDFIFVNANQCIVLNSVCARESIAGAIEIIVSREHRHTLTSSLATYIKMRDDMYNQDKQRKRMLLDC